MQITKTSILTGIEHTREIDITEDQLNRITINQEHVQHVVPHLSADDREFLISGITAEEWADNIPEEE
jgi:hypothetical protein